MYISLFLHAPLLDHGHPVIMQPFFLHGWLWTYEQTLIAKRLPLYGVFLLKKTLVSVLHNLKFFYAYLLGIL